MKNKPSALVKEMWIYNSYVMAKYNKQRIKTLYYKIRLWYIRRFI